MLRTTKDTHLKHKTAFCCRLFCLLALISTWGCGSKQPSEVEKKQALAGQPGKKFDPGTIPPEYKAGFEKWQKGNNAKVSGPVTPTGSP